MSESITVKFCKAIADIVKNHEDELSYDDIAGNLLTTAAAFSKTCLGDKRSSIQLAIQMAIILDGDHKAMKEAVDFAIKAFHTVKLTPVVLNYKEN